MRWLVDFVDDVDFDLQLPLVLVAFADEVATDSAGVDAAAGVDSAGTDAVEDAAFVLLAFALVADALEEPAVLEDDSLELELDEPPELDEPETKAATAGPGNLYAPAT